MQQSRHRLLRPLAFLALAGLASLAVSIAGAIGAKSQEILPYDFVAAPAGTNILLYYHFYGHNTEYIVRNGPTIKNSGLEINTDLAVYGHFFSIAGHPFLLQLKQNFGSLSGGYVGGQGLGSVYGAGVTNVTASFWPYSDAATRTNVSIVGSLNLPISFCLPEK